MHIVGACFGGNQSVELGLADDIYTVLEETVATLIQVALYIQLVCL